MGEKKEENYVKYVIDRETAEEEFKRFCEGWEIDADKSSMTEEDKGAFESQKANFINAVKRGRLIYNEDESLTYKFSNKVERYKDKELIIKRPKGASYMEMDRFKDQQGVHKTYAVVGAMTGHEAKYFSEVDGIDLKPLNAIVVLFLAG